MVKYRKMFRHTGCGVLGSWGIHNNSLNNVRRSIMERIFCVEVDGELVPTPQPSSPDNFVVRCEEFRAKLLAVAPKFLPLSDEQFVDRYQGRKKVRYQAAADSLQLRGVERKDSNIDMFIKGEKINVDLKPDPAPRAIQPRGYRYTMSLGKLIAHVEKPLFKCIDRVFQHPTVLKGYNSIKTASIMKSNWDHFTNPVAVGLDASRFDQHVSVNALLFEHSVWPSFMARSSDRDELRKLLSWQLKSFGRARCSDGTAKYTVEGTRASGDMNTSSGNCLIMCALVYSFINNRIQYRLANNGDDCVLIFDKSNLKIIDELKSWFSEMGFTMKVEQPVYEFEQIEFCQCQPVYCFDEYRMIRKPSTTLSKDLTANYRLDFPAYREAWYDAVRSGGLALNDGCPMFGSFYNCFPASSKRRKIHLDHFESSGLQRMSEGIKYRAKPITARSRYSFWLAFGVPPDSQIAFENKLSGFKLSDCALKGPGQWVETAAYVGPHLSYQTRIKSLNGPRQ